MSFKQMQKAKRQKRSNTQFIGQPGANSGGQNRQSRLSPNGGSNMAGGGNGSGQSPLHQFYAATKNQPTRQ